MSLITNVQNAILRVSTECKTIRSLLNGNAADNAILITTAKSSLLAAINEVKAQANATDAAGYTKIDDTASTSSSRTYSIDKIHAEIASTAQVTKDAILGGAGAAYDTLKELQTFLEGEAADIASIMAALGNRVRTDTATQGLSAQQQLNARTNINVHSKTEIGDPDTNFVSIFEAGLV